jgi:hypothetical protein
LLKEYGSHVPDVSIIPGITNVIASPILAQNQEQIEFTIGIKAIPGLELQVLVPVPCTLMIMI